MSRPAASRAVASAAIVELEAVSRISPNQPAGKPSMSSTQASVRCSSSVAAGDVRQSMALTFSALAISSPTMPGPEPVMPKYAKNAGWFQCVIPGRIRLSRSPRIASNGSPRSGARSGRRAAMSPGDTCESTGRSPTDSRYPDTHAAASASASRTSAPVGPGPVTALMRGVCQPLDLAAVDPRSGVVVHREEAPGAGDAGRPEELPGALVEAVDEG